MDRVGAFLSEKTPRRFVAIATFIAIIVAFRHLLPLMLFFVAFERPLGTLSLGLARRTGIGRKPALMILVGVAVAVTAGAATFGVGRAMRQIHIMRDTFPERIASIRESALYEQIHEQFTDTEKLLDGAKHYGGDALHYAAAVGHILAYATIGFILAVVYLLERDHIDEFTKSMAPRALPGTMVRWVGHVADALIVTVQLQLIVAACNTLLTLPVLLLLHIPHVGSLMVLIFISGLVPVIGNVISGVVLSILAYQAKGPLGVGLFIGLTAILHKIESYYLNPRLTARHVQLPGFVLIVSLIAWEHLLGFVGLFVSFPLLFVLGKIRAELKAEDAEAAAVAAAAAE